MRPYCPRRAYRATRIYNATYAASTVACMVALALLLGGMLFAATYPARLTVGVGMFATGLALLAMGGGLAWLAGWYYRRA